MGRLLRHVQWARCLICVMLATGCAAAPFSVKSHPVRGEFIVQFHAYLTHEVQRGIFDEGMGKGAWEFVEASRPFTGDAPSDFAAIRVATPGDEAPMLAHPRVKSVVPERRILLPNPGGSPDPGLGARADSAGKARLFGSSEGAAGTTGNKPLHRPGRRVLQFLDGGGGGGRSGGRRLLSISDSYNAKQLWDKGFKGEHIKVRPGRFDLRLTKLLSTQRTSKGRLNNP